MEKHIRFYFKTFFILSVCIYSSYAHNISSRITGAHSVFFLNSDSISLNWYIFDEDLQFLLNIPSPGHNTDHILKSLNTHKSKITTHIKSHVYFVYHDKKIEPELTGFEFEPPAYWKISLKFSMPDDYRHDPLQFIYDYPFNILGQDRLTMAFYNSDLKLIDTLYLHRNYKKALIHLPDFKNQLTPESFSLKTMLVFNLIFVLASILILIPFKWPFKGHLKGYRTS